MNRLTAEQRKAISHKAGAACVIAGAGTGKTTALAERISFLVEKRHILPSHILVTTFTRKATAELYERAFQRLGSKAAQVNISTIDALILDLAKEAAALGMMRYRNLIGEANRRALLFQCAWETLGQVDDGTGRREWAYNAGKNRLLELLEKSVRAEMAATAQKTKLLTDIRSLIREKHYRIGYAQLTRIVQRYFQKLRDQNATDSELLSRDFLSFLKRDAIRTRRFFSKFDAILVDEFQDCSRFQSEILLLLSGKSRNIWVVGDPCQQIYEWRGAAPENLRWFIRKTKANRYFLSKNWRSTQPILDSAYEFLSQRIPKLKRNRMLQQLESQRDLEPANDARHPVYTGTLSQAMALVNSLSTYLPDPDAPHIAIISRDLRKCTRDEIQRSALKYRWNVQFQTSSADRALEELGFGNHGQFYKANSWKGGTALNKLYKMLRDIISDSLRSKDFARLRTIRPISEAAEALDNTIPRDGLTLGEAWPVLRKTQDKEVDVSSAVGRHKGALSAMTIHSAKGLEFPIVLLMKFSETGRFPFPDRNKEEDHRLVYVGATRARDILMLVHTNDKPTETLNAFGNRLLPIPKNLQTTLTSLVSPKLPISVPPLIAATHLDLYEQCRLRFAAYHEGRFLPQWTIQQSMGSRIHKSLEYYLRADMPKDVDVINQCFNDGFRDGDSPLRKLPMAVVKKMKFGYQNMVKEISANFVQVLGVEKRYRYLHGHLGQIEGIVDAILKAKDGRTVLCEWKSSHQTAGAKKRQYQLQARAGALGLKALQSIPIDKIQIVPIFNPKARLTFSRNRDFDRHSKEMLDKVFTDLKDPTCEPRKGSHCKECELRRNCPAWPMR